MKKMPDWLIRSLKTFAQTFGGVLIPELCAILSNGFPANWSVLWACLAPVIASALSAAICAVWNIILERMG